MVNHYQNPVKLFVEIFKNDFFLAFLCLFLAKFFCCFFSLEKTLNFSFFDFNLKKRLLLKIHCQSNELIIWSVHRK